MRPVSLDELARDPAAYDQAVVASDHLDRFCSSSHWILPAIRALQPARDTWIRRGEHGWAVFAERPGPGGMTLQPFELMWGLTCPVVGDDGRALAHELAAAVLAPGSARRCPLLIGGLERGSPRFNALGEALSARFRLALGPVTRRWVASLEGGVEGWLSRRSPNLRRALARAARRAADAGIRFETAVAGDEATALAVYERLLAVESRSWKGRAGVGFAASEMIDFYRDMLPALARAGAVRLMFATRDGADVGYIFGAVFGDAYRGLQFSQAEDSERMSLGNLLQVEQVRRLCADGVRRYDLGSDVPYKRRWGEQAHDTVLLLAIPR